MANDLVFATREDLYDKIRQNFPDVATSSKTDEFRAAAR